SDSRSFCLEGHEVTQREGRLCRFRPPPLSLLSFEAGLNFLEGASVGRHLDLDPGFGCRHPRRAASFPAASHRHGIPGWPALSKRPVSPPTTTRQSLVVPA